MKKYIVFLVSIILDGLIPNITLFNFNNITYFTPLCTVVSLVFLYNDRKDFIKLWLMSSLIYGSLYIHNLFLSFILFFVILLVIKGLKRLFTDTLIINLIEVILVICIYDFIFFSIHSLIVVNHFIWKNYFYKILHSIIFNFIYGIILFFVFPKKSSKLNY